MCSIRFGSMCAMKRAAATCLKFVASMLCCEACTQCKACTAPDTTGTDNSTAPACRIYKRRQGLAQKAAEAPADTPADAAADVSAAGGSGSTALSDVIAAAPRLLEVLPSDALAALLAVNSLLRQQVHGFVTTVSIPADCDRASSNVLRNTASPSLKSWKMEPPSWQYRVMIQEMSSHMLVRFMSIYSKQQAPWMRSLALRAASQPVVLPIAAIAEVSKGQWPLLEFLVIRNCGLTAAGLQQLAVGQ